MAPGFPNEFKELVRARTNLVDLVGERVSLSPRRGGREYVGLCPFHDDHNPSLTVSPERQSYKCWSCGAGGDCYSFIMELDKVGFRETLELLARRAGLELPQTLAAAAPQDRDAKAKLYEVLAWAENEFHNCLLKAPEAAPAREYLKDRGFNAETIGKFRLGYHPNDWEWLLGRARKKFPAQLLFDTRLAGERRDGSGYVDYFVDRVLFPIRDAQGRPVAFGGRVLPGHSHADAPKYFNSPEHSLFAKSRLLYGFDAAREAIRRSQTAVIAEGYTDCVLCYQHGVQNVVAVLGVALSEDHVRLLKRFSRKVVLMLDGDEAGQRATERVLPRVLAEEVDLRILVLPSGLDPAEYVAAHGADALSGLIENAAEAWDHKLRLSVDKFGLDSIDARHRVLDDMLTLLAQAPRLAGSDRENLILSRLSQRLALQESRVRDSLQDLRRKQAGRAAATARLQSPPSKPAKPAYDGRNPDDALESDLLEIILAAPALVEEICGQVGPDDFRNEHLRDLFVLCCDLAEAGDAPTYDRVVATIEEPGTKRLVNEIDERARDKEISRRVAEDVDPVTGRPRLLDEAVGAIRRRRDRQTHESLKCQLAQQDAAVLSDDLKEMLRRSTQFHQKRAL